MRYYMFNKPRGCITACRDERQKTLMEYVPQNEREGLFPIGRLDKDTEGFIILTDDGKFSARICSPNSNITKTYRFYAKGELTSEKIQRLEGGVDIGTRDHELTSPAKVKKLAVCPMRDIAHLFPEQSAKLKNTRHGDVPVTYAELVITEGKKHQVKRMMKAVGMTVIYLERVAISGVFLDEVLPRGEFRQLSEAEIAALSSVI